MYSKVSEQMFIKKKYPKPQSLNTIKVLAYICLVWIELSYKI